MDTFLAVVGFSASVTVLGDKSEISAQGVIAAFL